ncbi:MAG TPA: M23 family metallopeptidase [Bacteroidales bacterium]|jgi:hypothetical protein|nr:M23 family metallopeptidase [Bacteroidales bacterium]
MYLVKYFLASLLILTSFNHNPKDRSIFAPPVKIPVLLSSNFGELRIDHFHSGVDIKTQGVTGKEVVSAADGYIYRISISPSGFGKALYVKHPSGYSTVYAHLERFTPEIDSYVKSVQYERKSFLVTMFPSKEKFPVKKGQLIAYSGNSGSSGGPHLHFEIREADNELPVNPLLFNIGVSDHIAPVIEKLAIYPERKDTYINNAIHPVRLNVVKTAEGKFSLAEGNEIRISGSAGFGLKIYDLLDGAANKCAAYSISLSIDSTTVYNYVMDGFSFNESRFVNSHIDYETYMRSNIYIQRAFVLPNDRLENYRALLNRGIFNFNDEKTHKVKITVTDASENKSVLAFNVKSVKEKPLLISPPETEFNELMPYNKINRFTSEDMALNIPSGTLYDTLHFRYKKSPGSPLMLSDLHSVHNIYTPVQKAFSLSIKPKTIADGKESKMMIVKLLDNMSKVPVSSTYSEGFVRAEVSSFGNYFVGMDTVSPSISPIRITPGADLTGRKEIRIKISDDFSGIKSYEPVIDNKWALFEYDPKNNVLIYQFDEKYLSKGTRHLLTLKVSDNVDNVTSYSCDFKW